MKTPKIKRYRLGVSRKFPTTHPRKGENTGFVDSIYFGNKIHTIRRNLEKWSKIILQVQEGKAIIQLCYWQQPGGRFVKGNQQIVFAELDKDSGCGVQEVVCINQDYTVPTVWDVKDSTQPYFSALEIAQNDGLSLEDFKAWFKGYDLSQPMAIIHFTSFRY